MECDELTQPRNIPEDFDDDGVGDDFDDDDIEDERRPPEEHELSRGKPHNSRNAPAPRITFIHWETMHARIQRTYPNICVKGSVQTCPRRRASLATNV